MTSITLTDIASYRRYDGDLDWLSRSADRGALSSRSVWRLLEDLRQRAVIVARGRGSAAFRRDLDSDLAVHLADSQAFVEFWRIVAADLARTAASEVV